MSKTAAFDFSTRPENTAGATRRETPLHHIKHHNASSAGIELTEAAFCAHLTLRGNPNNADFLAGVEKALGVALPVTALSSSASADYHVLWIGPDEWLILAPSKDPAAVEAALRAELTGHYAVVDVSGGQTLLSLSGKDVMLLLQKSCGYDVEGEFPVGKAITTHFAKASVVLYHQAQGNYLMVVRRSFADYVWRWLADASGEYGLMVKGA